MKTPHFLHLLVLLGLLSQANHASAQQMPQDNWRYDGIEFSAPDSSKALRSIAIGSGGVYVGRCGTGDANSAATVVLQFQESGTFVRQFSATFTYILGIACDSSGNVYVLDRGDSKVKVYDKNGTFVRNWGGPGSGNGQFSIAAATGTTMIAVDKNNQIYVCDPGNTRVQVFDASGTFLRKWGELGSLPGQFAAGDPDGIACSQTVSAYVICNQLPAIRVFDSQGLLLRTQSDLWGSFAVSADGLLLCEYWEAALLDTQLNMVASLGYDWYSTSIAFNLRGDIYRLNGTKVTVYEREYSNVHNALLPTAIPQPMVINVAQRSGVPLLDIDYKVTDADSATVTTGALAFLNGNNTLADVIPMNTFVEGTTANIGANQTTNVEKRITWDMATDWSVDFAQIQIGVLAKDSRNPLGIHWITVPAEGSQPAVQISRQPVADARLLELWYWFLATHQSGMTFAGGTIKGSAGLYNGAALASGTATTTAGRLFAYEKLGVRTISGTELSRALAGSYGFVSIDANSVVRETVAPSSFVQAAGYNWCGQTNATAALAGAAKVAAGNYHTMVLKTDGTLWGLGYNDNGELGDGTTTRRSTPVQVATGVTQVAAGSHHTLYVKSDGTLWVTGYNNSGQLGDGTNSNRSTPVQVDTGVAQVAAGDTYSLYVKTNGTLWVTGNNGSGQLGNATNTSRNTPWQLDTGVAQVAGGGGHTLYVKTDGTLWATGNNGSGQLGNGTNTTRNTPVQVTTGVAKVAAGSDHSMFVKTDGTLWATGNNGSGQLGNGTTTNRSTPGQVDTSVTSVAGGGSVTMYVKTAGTLWAMGYNNYGQLGDGTTTTRTSPVQVASGSKVTQVAVGRTGEHSVWIVTAP